MFFSSSLASLNSFSLSSPEEDEGESLSVLSYFTFLLKSVLEFSLCSSSLSSDELLLTSSSNCLVPTWSMLNQGSHFSGLTKFPDFSLTFPVFFAIFQYFFQ